MHIEDFNKYEEFLLGSYESRLRIVQDSLKSHIKSLRDGGISEELIKEELIKEVLREITGRFKENEDCYLDTKTGLEWSLCDLDIAMTWKEAIEACKTLGYGWRLPSIGELFSVLSFDKCSPATDLPGILSDYYWSSTPYAYDSDRAWDIYFNDGNDHYSYKSCSYYVRAVRKNLRFGF